MHSSRKNIETCVCLGDSACKTIGWFSVDKNGEAKYEISEDNHKKLCSEVSSILYESYKNLFKV